MRILYVATKYVYQRPHEGFSFEHCNFHDSLVQCGHEVIYFDFPTLLADHGPEGMNRRLFEMARQQRPDLAFFVLIQDEFDHRTVRRLSDDLDIPTVNWFCDDHFRFETFTRHWAPCFRWSVTTTASALSRYADIGYDSVIQSQWACNPHLYRKLDLPWKYDVTFVGQTYGHRKPLVERLRRAGLNVQAFGDGWENGRLSSRQMIEVFNQSRVNLNLSAASTPPSPTPTLGQRMRGHASATLNHLPGGHAIKAAVRSWRGRSPDQTANGRNETSLDPLSHRGPSQIKGRNFEVPGSGGFLLTETADQLEDYYEPGVEIALWQDMDDLIEKARYYLRHEAERAAVAEAGYQRTLAGHTYAHRFQTIFERMGLEAPEPAVPVAGSMNEAP